MNNKFLKCIHAKVLKNIIITKPTKSVLIIHFADEME